MAKKIIVGGVTVNQTPIDWKHNTENIINAIQKANIQNIDLLCFPELCITGYGCEDLFLAPWLTRKALEMLQEIALHVKNMTVCVGLPIRIKNQCYNGVAVIHHQSIQGITLKQNLAKKGVHYESRWFHPWPSDHVSTINIGGEKIPAGDLLYQCKGITFGLEICEDAWVKNRPAEKFYAKGVDLIVNASASHYTPNKVQARIQKAINSSSTYQCVYLYVNLLGNEAGDLIYDGDIIFAQHGRILKQNRRCSFHPLEIERCILHFNNQPNNVSEAIPLLPDYDKDENEDFTQVASLALFDYWRKSKSKGFVVSLSGGADSACCAVLITEMIRRGAKALGWESFSNALGIPKLDASTAIQQSLTCVYQSSKNSSSETKYAAKTLATSLGCRYYQWSIEEEIDTYTATVENAIQQKLDWHHNDKALQNIQARSRSPVIWLLANIKNYLLITSSNQSEGSVGYATMDGDTSGGLAPLANVEKTFILQWLHWAEKTLSYKGLHAVNQLKPTAELRPVQVQQSDEEDLMPYPLLTAIEKYAIQQKQSPQEVYDSLSTQFDDVALRAGIDIFFRRWSSYQWKRERTAVAFHLRDFNTSPKSEYRFPILSGNFESELDKLHH